jgi:hypothetical protein
VEGWRKRRVTLDSPTHTAMPEAEILAYAHAKRFGAGTTRRWLGCGDAEREALLVLAERLRLGENQFRDVLDQLEDIAARRGLGLAAVLAEAPLRQVIEGNLGRNEAIRALKLLLRRLRYPQLVESERRLAELARGLGLPAGVRVVPPENLEGDHLCVTLRARSAKELRAQARALAIASEKHEIDEMFERLGGNW